MDRSLATITTRLTARIVDMSSTTLSRGEPAGIWDSSEVIGSRDSRVVIEMLGCGDL